MGGYGSTRWADHPARPRVEDCAISLSATSLAHIQPPVRGTLTWPTTGLDGSPGEVPFDIESLSGGQRTLRLVLQVGMGKPDQTAVQTIRMVALPMPRGGVRWLFSCPTCQRRRALRLYVAPTGSELACRRCSGLLYRSSRRSDGRISWLRRDPVAFRVALTAPRNLAWSRVGLEAQLKEIEAICRGLGSRDPRRRLLTLARIDPPLVARLLRKQSNRPDPEATNP